VNVELVEPEEGVRGVLDRTEEGSDDDEAGVGRVSTRLVRLSIPPGSKGFPVLCDGEGLVVLDVEPPLGGTRLPRTPPRPCLLLRRR